MKKENTKSKNKLLIFTNLFLIFVLMVVGVYAWFAAQSDNRADAYDITVLADNPLELSLDGRTWSSNLNLNTFIEADDFQFKEVTGTGESNDMWVPELKQHGNYAIPDTTSDWREAIPNKDYLEVKVLMRSRDKLDVYIGSNSYAEPVSKILTGVNAENKSSYATGVNAFSKDCIVGALRVGFQTTNATKYRYVWIPRSDIHLNNTVGSDVYDVKVSSMATYKDGSPIFTINEPYFWNNPKSHYYYYVNNGSDMKIETMEHVWTKLPDTVNTIANYDSQVAQLRNTMSFNGVEYYYTTATITIWIEGCDTEARRALSGGKFNLALKLDSFSAA